jgi:hypothetical protein
MELYLSFVKLAPLLILKLLATDRFGPSEPDKGRQGRVAFAGDVVLMDVLPPTATTRGVLVVAGCLSLLVLANSTLGQIASLYRARPRARSLGDTSGGASADTGEST